MKGHSRSGTYSTEHSIIPFFSCWLSIVNIILNIAHYSDVKNLCIVYDIVFWPSSFTWIFYKLSKCFHKISVHPNVIIRHTTDNDDWSMKLRLNEQKFGIISPKDS